jgi:hypothetical protein
MELDLDIPAWTAYAVLVAISLYTAAAQVDELLKNVAWHWAYLSTYFLFALFFALPVTIFWGLDRVGAIHDSSLISALIVAFTYQAIVNGQSETKNSAVSSLFKPILDWMNKVPERLGARAQIDAEEFATAVANAVGRDVQLLSVLQAWVEAHTSDIVTLRQRMQEFGAANPQPPDGSGQELAASVWSKAKADRLLLFVEPTLPVKWAFARKGLLPWRSFWNAAIQLDRTMRWCVPTAILLALAYIAGQWIGPRASDAVQQSLYINPRLYRLDSIMPRYYSWRYLKANNTPSDVKRSLNYLAIGLEAEIPTHRGATRGPADSSYPYSTAVTGILQNAELTPPLADGLLKVIFADRLDHNDINASCAALRLLPSALRSPNVEIRALLGRTLSEAGTALWDPPEKLSTQPKSIDIGPQASTVNLETAVVAWFDYLKLHCDAPPGAGVITTPAPVVLPGPVIPPATARPPEVDGLTMPDVTFAFGSANLLSAASPILEPLAKQLRDQPENRADISGYTDSIGTAAYNLKLSYARARSVAEFLKNLGVDADRVSICGFGARDPIASNDTEAGREKNRRVVIKISGGAKPT